MVSVVVVGDSPDVLPDDVLGYAFGDGVLVGGDENSVSRIVSQFNSGDGSSSGNFPVFPLGLSLDQGKPGLHMAEEGSSDGSIGRRIRLGAEVKSSSEADRDLIQLSSMFPTFGHVQSHQICHNPPQVQQLKILKLNLYVLDDHEFGFCHFNFLVLDFSGFVLKFCHSPSIYTDFSDGTITFSWS
ncbi:hypothetical protein KSP40_PGU012762 [Platanthera guangdongensis]|uniref:Uncharacterized protein n=1 Tax=Platanthera guangdongensis TaxID=2320717 RepID=A0ABR2N535_9ASPA